VFFPTVLVSQGYTVANSLFFTMIINVGGLVGAILASYFAAKLPRRWVLGFGALIAVGVAVLYAMVKSTELIVLVGALMQLMFIFLNTTTWLYAPELYPTRVRAFGTGASVVVALVSASVMPYVAGIIFDVADVIGLFGMVAVMYVIMSAAVFLMNVETKDRSLEEVSEA
jgi:fucose permease